MYVFEQKMEILNKNQGWRDPLILSVGMLGIKIHYNVIPVQYYVNRSRPRGLVYQLFIDLKAEKDIS